MRISLVLCASLKLYDCCSEQASKGGTMRMFVHVVGVGVGGGRKAEEKLFKTAKMVLK